MSHINFRAGENPQVDAYNGGDEVVIVFRDGVERVTITIEAHSKLLARIAEELRNLALFLEEMGEH